MKSFNLSNLFVLHASHSLRVIGKGNKEREAFCQPAVWTRLEAWLVLRSVANPRGRVFCAVNKHHQIDTGKELTSQAIYNVMRSRAEGCGVSQFSPHDLRRTFATKLFSLGADANLVKMDMGHSDIATTQLYDKRSSDAVKKFTEKFTF